MKRKGFTLIELLVVVAIIAVLISILLPALGRARDQAKAMVCMSNLHNFGQGLHMYGFEYNDWLPKYDSTLSVVYWGWNDGLATGYVPDIKLRRQWISFGLLYKLKYLKVDFRKGYYCPINPCYFKENGPENPDLMSDNCSKQTNYWYVGGLYTVSVFDNRSKLTDNGGRTIMTDAGLLFNGIHGDKMGNVLYLGGDVASKRSPECLNTVAWTDWFWQLLDRQAKD